MIVRDEETWRMKNVPGSAKKRGTDSGTYSNERIASFIYFALYGSYVMVITEVMES